MIPNSRADRVIPYEKSIVLGGTEVLTPIAPENTEAFARILQRVIRDAEQRAYDLGRESLRKEFCELLQVERHYG